MKALTLTQPWASLVAVGAKRLETRSWRTDYRGPLAIHAAKAFDRDQLMYMMSCWPYHDALLPIGGTMGATTAMFPVGCVIALCNLTACRRTADLTVGELDPLRWHRLKDYAWCERKFGNYEPGRYAFTLTDVQPIVPIPVRGMLGLWEWKPEAVTPLQLPAGFLEAGQ